MSASNSRMPGQMTLDVLCRRCSGPMPVDWPYAYCRGCINGPMRDEAMARGLRT